MKTTLHTEDEKTELKCKKHRVFMWKRPASCACCDDEPTLYCPTCDRVSRNKREREIKAGRYVYVVQAGKSFGGMSPTYHLFKKKPRERLTVGMFVTIDVKTGYLRKCTVEDKDSENLFVVAK